MNPRLTKIIATLGPASGNKNQIRGLARAGVNVFRLNLSHGDHSVVRRWIKFIREVEAETGIFLGILLDLQGPKIRVGKFEGGSILLHKGQKVVLSTDRGMGRDGWIPVQYAHFPKEVKPGDPVFLDDGKLCVRANRVIANRVEAQVEVGGRLSNFKGLNLPDALIQTSPLTRKDRADLKFGLHEGVDFVALSFVGMARDVLQLRRLIRSQGGDAEVVAKIERKQAVQNLDEIVEASDAVMVARGDLGIEMPLSDVPVVQLKILQACAKHAKPVIVATQMLETMIENSRPTRAEISDISNSVSDCADAIMLSGETAVGKHPRAAVSVMVETALKTEEFQRENQRILPWSWFFKDQPPVHLGITYSANRLVELLGAKAIMLFTLTGGTARMVSSPHPMVPLLAFTSCRKRARKLTLVRGAVPFMVEESKNFLENLGELFRLLKKNRLVKKGDRVVITTGLPMGIPQWTNVIRVERVP